MKYIKQIFLQLIKVVLKRKNMLVVEEGKVVDGEKVAVEINLLPEVKVKAPIRDEVGIVDQILEIVKVKAQLVAKRKRSKKKEGKICVYSRETK